MRILSILVRHGRQQYAGALADLQTYQRQRLPDARCDVLVVDNGPGPVLRGAGEPETIAGPNDHWEFSAWDAGLAHVGDRLGAYDLVHLVTSAFRTLYTRYIDRCDTRTLRRALGRRAAVGHVDCYDTAIEVLGHRSQSWLRSSFLFLPPSELRRLGSLVAVRDGEPFFSGDPARPFRPEAPLSPTYQRYLLGWLTGEGTGQGTEWHSRFSLTAETLPRFEAKTLAILNEHLLTARLRRQGCAVVDATWLAGRSGRPRWWSGALVIPPWDEQLAGRDADAIAVARVEPPPGPEARVRGEGAT